MKKTELYPLGLRRDGSYYTRIEWASHTESNPLFWVLNIIDDDIERSGGTYGANTMGPVNVVLSFFGELQVVDTIKFFTNVGLPISIIEELASDINIYICNDGSPRDLKSDTDNIESVNWEKIMNCKIKKEESWQTFKLNKPIAARYIRIEMVKNFGTPPEIPWTETSEVKFFPS
jgi:hypothetical protein